jgi:hypothetical protein
LTELLFCFFGYHNFKTEKWYMWTLNNGQYSAVVNHLVLHTQTVSLVTQIIYKKYVLADGIGQRS